MTAEQLKQYKKETEALRKYEREMLLKLQKNESKSQPIRR
jgi:hypothetical protein